MPLAPTPHSLRTPRDHVPARLVPRRDSCRWGCSQMAADPALWRQQQQRRLVEHRTDGCGTPFLPVGGGGASMRRSRTLALTGQATSRLEPHRDCCRWGCPFHLACQALLQKRLCVKPGRSVEHNITIIILNILTIIILNILTIIMLNILTIIMLTILTIIMLTILNILTIIILNILTIIILNILTIIMLTIFTIIMLTITIIIIIVLLLLFTGS
ncbi:unnamed protein product [Lampetra fluviatilis]